MIRYQWICAAVLPLLLPVGGWAADAPGSQSGNKVSDQTPSQNAPTATSVSDPTTESDRIAEWDARLGWWSFWNNGSPQKTGEYQDLKSGPFFNLDGFASDGISTFDASVIGSDNETTTGKVHFFQNNVTADVDYERFLHRRDHDPLGNMLNPDQSIPGSPNPPDPKIVKEDISVGQDYAVRVQEFKTSVKWLATGNFKARVDVWGMEKEGTRQANGVAMCYTSTTTGTGPHFNLSEMPNGHPLTSFPGQKCHLLSQSQHIDWMTTEVKPVFEFRLGDSCVVEYSRPMRGFTANDQTVGRFYDHRTFPLEGGEFPVNGPSSVFANYGVVPSNTTEMDQVKISGQINENNRAYAYLMAGNTVQKEIDMHRWFNDADVRLTNTSIDNVTVTGYGKVFNESESPADAARVLGLVSTDRLIVGPGPAPSAPTSVDLDEPIGYRKGTAGVRGVWRVSGQGFDRGGLAITSGYEYGDLHRTNAIFTGDGTPSAVLDESRTITNSFQIGPDYRWSSALDTYARYKFQLADQPLIGFKGDNGVFNTLLPRNDHIVEVGFNWVPADWFIFNACVGIETSDNHSSPAAVASDPTLSTIRFNEQNYPMTCSLWYAVNDRFSLSAGYSVFSNFVAQNVVVGDDPPPYDGVSSIRPVKSPWNYGAQAHVVTFGSRYAASDRVTLTGEMEWVRGRNQITDSTTFFRPAGTRSPIWEATRRCSTKARASAWASTGCSVLAS